jgi:hypothetical protein
MTHFQKHLIILYHFVSVQLRDILLSGQVFGRALVMPPRLQLTPAVFVCGVNVSFATPSDDFTRILNTLGTLHPLNCTY